MRHESRQQHFESGIDFFDLRPSVKEKGWIKYSSKVKQLSRVYFAVTFRWRNQENAIR